MVHNVPFYQSMAITLSTHSTGAMRAVTSVLQIQYGYSNCRVLALRVQLISMATAYADTMDIAFQGRIYTTSTYLAAYCDKSPVILMVAKPKRKHEGVT